MDFQFQKFASPLAPLLVVVDSEGRLRALDFVDYESRMHRLLKQYYGDYVLEQGEVPACIFTALDAYFDGDLSALEVVPIAMGGTPFQRSVWTALRTIEPGTTKSYGQVAAEIGRPGASRAVGAANGANPIAIVIPCHRVIGAGGALTGYGGSLPRKQWLLEHEARYDLRVQESRRLVKQVVRK